MMTLRELFEVFWTITELEITARDPNTKYLHRWIYGPEALKTETIHQYHDRMAGKLTIVEAKLNAHGDPARGGAEIGWGVKEKLLPKELIDAPITHMGVIGHHSGEHTVYVDVEMQELTAMAIVPKEKKEEENNDADVPVAAHLKTK